MVDFPVLKFRTSLTSLLPSSGGQSGKWLEVEPGKNGGEMAPCFYAMSLPFIVVINADHLRQRETIHGTMDGPRGTVHSATDGRGEGGG